MLSREAVGPANRLKARNSVAFIPARGGSKRIPRKNIRLFNGRPMLEWPVKAALESGVFSRVVVSTDDEEIAKTALRAGAEVPFLRPKKLGADTVGAVAVVHHAIRTLGLADSALVMNLYPTSPLPPNMLRQATAVFEQDRDRFLISVGRYRTPVERALRLSDGLMSHHRHDAMHKRTQDFDESFFDAGKFHLATVGLWNRSETMMASPFIPFVLPAWAAVDIDEPEDWEIAELLHREFVLKGAE